MYTTIVKNKIKGFVFNHAAKLVHKITPVATNTPSPLTTLKTTAFC